MHLAVQIAHAAVLMMPLWQQMLLRRYSAQAPGSAMITAEQLFMGTAKDTHAEHWASCQTCTAESILQHRFLAVASLLGSQTRIAYARYSRLSPVWDDILESMPG